MGRVGKFYSLIVLNVRPRGGATNNGSFIERHGLVRYTGRLGRRYPRTGQCEVGACRLIRQQDADRRAALAAQLARVLDDLAALVEHRAMVLVERPADDDGRRARRRKLDHARLRRIALEAERDCLGHQLDLCTVTAQRLAERPGPLVFDHCHAHGWVRGLACHDCNVLLGAVDARRITAGDSAWMPAVLAFRRNCPDCRVLDDEGKP